MTKIRYVILSEEDVKLIKEKLSRLIVILEIDPHKIIKTKKDAKAYTLAVSAISAFILSDNQFMGDVLSTMQLWADNHLVKNPDANMERNYIG